MKQLDKLVENKKAELLDCTDFELMTRVNGYLDQRRLNYDGSGKVRDLALGYLADEALMLGVSLTKTEREQTATDFAALCIQETEVFRYGFTLDPGDIPAKDASHLKFHLSPDPENGPNKRSVLVSVVLPNGTYGGEMKPVGYLPTSVTNVHPLAEDRVVDGYVTDLGTDEMSFFTVLDTDVMDLDFSYAAQEASAHEETLPQMEPQYFYSFPFTLDENARWYGSVSELIAHEDGAYIKSAICDFCLDNNDISAFDTEVNPISFSLTEDESGTGYFVIGTTQELRRETLETLSDNLMADNWKEDTNYQDLVFQDGFSKLSEPPQLNVPEAAASRVPILSEDDLAALSEAAGMEL